ncbi:hypothetical protein PESP_a0061 [Pseudoalteromonas espejiana DSM 9414]|nr:hypothetical protein PESP_a0061 [Pseudoalteromonas espejiana DSM 9414]
MHNYLIVLFMLNLIFIGFSLYLNETFKFIIVYVTSYSD